MADAAKLEHSALMQELEWDLSTGQDPALRRLMRGSGNRPSTAPARRKESAMSSRSRGMSFSSQKAKNPQHPWNTDDFDVGGSQLGTFKSQRPTASAPPGGRRRRSSALVGEVSAQLNQRQEAWDTRVSRERGRKTLAHAAARAAEERMETQREQREEEERRLADEESMANDPRCALEAQARERRMRALSSRSAGTRLKPTREVAEDDHASDSSSDSDDDGGFRIAVADADADADAAVAAQAAETAQHRKAEESREGLLISGTQAATHRRAMPMAKRDWSAPGRWVVDVVGAIDS